MHNYPDSNRQLKILDQGRLTVLLRGVVRDRFDGSQNQAAAHAGIRQSQLSRIIRGKMKSIKRDTWRSLLTLLPPPKRRQFDRCFLDLLTQMTLKKHEVSLKERLRGITREQVEFEELVKHIRSEHRTLLDRLDGLFGNGAHDRLRRTVAYWEILNPLLQNERSGGVERDWSELKPSDRRAYLKSAIRCQEALLKGQNHVERAQQKSVASRESRVPDPSNPLEGLLAGGEAPLDRPLTESDVEGLWKKVRPLR